MANKLPKIHITGEYLGEPGLALEAIRRDLVDLVNKVDDLDEKVTEFIGLDHTDTAVADVIHDNVIELIKGVNRLLEKEGLDSISCSDRQGS